MSDRCAEFEEWGQKGYVQVVFEEKTGGFVVIHPRHGKNEWAQNAQIARMLARKGDALILMPPLKNEPSFDALRNGRPCEFKTVNSTNTAHALQNAIRKARVQAPEIICFMDNDGWENWQITFAIYNAVKFDIDLKIERIGILFRDERLVEMTRQDVLTEAFRNLFF